jgi:hypothetical protein
VRKRIGAAVMLGSAALVAGCGRAAAPADQQATANATKAAPVLPGPIAAAQDLVRRNSGAGEIRFGEARIYSHEGVAIVCGRYSRADAENQRYVAVSDLQVWLEPDMAPGEMDRAYGQYCRDGAANA